jgi:L-lactate dehydrogenase (cytochrome)
MESARLRRRRPRFRELRPLLGLDLPGPNVTERRLAAAATIEDLRTLAKRRTLRAAFDYADGAAEGEMSLARARQAFQDIVFHPQVLRDVSEVDTSVEVLGGPSALPFGIAPTGFTRLMRAEGERAGAAAAGGAGIPFSLSTLGTARSRRSLRQTQAAATGSSSTCGRTATGRSSSFGARPRRGSTRFLSRSTSRSRARACATAETG